MLVPDWSRRFIRGESRGCKVRFSQGEIIEPAVDAEMGRPVEADTGQPRNRSSGRLERKGIGERRKTRDLGKPGNWSIVVAKEEERGNLGIDQGEPDGERSEVTRTSHQPVPEDEHSGRPGY